MSRPILTVNISINDFKNFYWLKQELQSFCKEHGMSATGSKSELENRVETFITTGKVLKPVRKSNKVGLEPNELSLDTVIWESHRCSQTVRAFFESVIPNFHFSTYIQKYFKTNVGKTYQDVVNAWYEELERKKDPNYKKEIAPQFEYNTFIRDFFLDPNNRGKSRSEAIEAWNEIKTKRGSNKYVPSS